MSSLNNLSVALQKYILSFCDADELFTCGQVQKRWYAYVSQEDPWYALSTRNARRAVSVQYRLHHRRKCPTHDEDADDSTADALVVVHYRKDRPMSVQTAEVPFLTERSPVVPEKAGHNPSSRRVLAPPSSAAFNPFAQANDDALTAENNDSEEDSEGALRLGWVATIQCPIPPPPQSASLHHEFAWTSMARRYDGGHGGAREYYMRCLRYFRFSPQTTYGTYLGLEEEEEEDSGDDVDGERSSSGRRGHHRRNESSVETSSVSSATSSAASSIHEESEYSEDDSYVSPLEATPDTMARWQASGPLPADPLSLYSSTTTTTRDAYGNTGNFNNHGSNERGERWTSEGPTAPASAWSEGGGGRGGNLWNFEPTPNPTPYKNAFDNPFAAPTPSVTVTAPSYGGADTTTGGGAKDLLDELFAPSPSAPLFGNDAPQTSSGGYASLAQEYNFATPDKAPDTMHGDSTEPRARVSRVAREGTQEKSHQHHRHANAHRHHRGDRAGRLSAKEARRQRIAQCYECKCLRRSWNVQPGGAYCKLKRKLGGTTSAESTAVSASTSPCKIPLFLLSPNRFCLVSPNTQTWSTSLLTHLKLAMAQRKDRQRAAYLDRQNREETQDGSEGLFQGNTMSISFKVEVNVAGAGDRRSGSVGCFIGFVDASQASRFQLQPTAASLARRKSALLREQSRPNYGPQRSRHSTWGSAGAVRGLDRGEAEEDEDEVANMIAALAEDIQAKESASTSSGDARYDNARRWWSAPPPAYSDHTTATAAVSSSSASRAGAVLFGDTENDHAHYNTTTTTGNDVNTSSGDDGGVFVGDCTGSYGLNVMSGYLYQNGNAYYLADPKSYRGNSSQQRQPQRYGHVTDGAASDGHTADIYTLVFNFEDDCVSLHTASGQQIGIVLVDAFSDGQTWLPAVSCKGCGVSVLPPMLRW